MKNERLFVALQTLVNLGATRKELEEVVNASRDGLNWSVNLELSGLDIKTIFNFLYPEKLKFKIMLWDSWSDDGPKEIDLDGLGIKTLDEARAWITKNNTEQNRHDGLHYILTIE